jgi:transporter family protein
VGNIALAAAIAMGAEASIVTPLTAMFPLVTLVLALVFLGERLNRIQAAGIALALVAIFVFSNVGATEPAELSFASLASPWMVAALLALLFFGIAGVTQKLSTNDISDELSTICYWLAALVVAGAVLVTQPFEWTLPVEAWTLALGAGVLAGLALWAGFAAYRGGKASVVTALIALYPIVTVVLAGPILGEEMNALKALAIGLAILAGLALGYERPGTTPGPVNGQSAVLPIK